MKKIILAIGILEDWVQYMPDLIEQAKATNSAVHILEFAAPLGTGLFTSNVAAPVTTSSDTEILSPSYIKIDTGILDSPDTEVETKTLDPQLTPGDTRLAAAETTAFVAGIAEYLRANGLEVSTAWLPAFDQTQLGEYARNQDADTVALVQRGWWQKLLEGDPQAILVQQGLKVIDLKASSLTPAEQIAISQLEDKEQKS